MLVQVVDSLMKTTKTICPGRPGRTLFRLSLAAAMSIAVLPAQAQAQWAAEPVQAALRSAAGSDRDLRAFYTARGHRPLWVQGDMLIPAADRFLEIIETAEHDGLDRGDYRPRSLASAIDKARGGSPKALAKAEMLLSRTFANYVRDVRRPREIGMIYVDGALAPKAPTTLQLLQAAAAAPSMQQYVDSAGWMHPVYTQLRAALVAQQMRPSYAAMGSAARQEELLRVNLERARVLPATDMGRHVLVDAASQRLWMYENGRVKDSMKVVVGKTTEQTPMMAGLIRFAMVNPYWNLPPDLARVRAQEVLKKGPAWLKANRYEVLSDWSDDAKVLKPASVDWKAVADGRVEIPMRQLPGPGNAMGKMKFMFPNEQGIYLHDTPERALFAKADRRFSSGCVRVEDAARLAKWLFGKPLAPKAGAPEKQVNLPEPVPVYITYLTAAPEGATIAFRSDVYNRDSLHLAKLEGRSFGTR
jgi:murein L,D-transpeptidase YcbB/YkuD